MELIRLKISKNELKVLVSIELYSSFYWLSVNEAFLKLVRCYNSLIGILQEQFLDLLCDLLGNNVRKNVSILLEDIHSLAACFKYLLTKAEFSS